MKAMKRIASGAIGAAMIVAAGAAGAQEEECVLLPNSNITLCKLTIESGRLVAAGKTQVSGQVVWIDGQFRSLRSDEERNFRIEAIYHPDECTVSMWTGARVDRQDQVVVGACTAEGPEGPTGPDGATGAQGPAGPAKSSQRVTGTAATTVNNPNPGVRLSATATCPSGTVLLNGGAVVTRTGGGSGQAAIAESFPSSATTWTATLMIVTNFTGTSTATITPHVVCTTN
jgi:hypothetical protein